MTGAGASTYIDVSARRYVTDLIPICLLDGNQVQGLTAWPKNISVSGSGCNIAWMRGMRRAF